MFLFKWHEHISISLCKLPLPKNVERGLGRPYWYNARTHLIITSSTLHVLTRPKAGPVLLGFPHPRANWRKQAKQATWPLNTLIFYPHEHLHWKCALVAHKCVMSICCIAWMAVKNGESEVGVQAQEAPIGGSVYVFLRIRIDQSETLLQIWVQTQCRDSKLGIFYRRRNIASFSDPHFPLIFLSFAILVKISAYFISFQWDSLVSCYRHICTEIHIYTVWSA